MTCERMCSVPLSGGLYDKLQYSIHPNPAQHLLPYLQDHEKTRVLGT